jgi:hypothetical protein
MPSESLSTANYAAVIRDLRAKRDELDRAIAFLESVSGLAAVAPVSPTTQQSAVPEQTAAMARPELAGLSQADACIWLLRKTGFPMTTRQIAEGLADAGYKTNATDPINNVSACLHHRSKGKADVVRDGKVWRLAEDKEPRLPSKAPTSLNGAEHHTPIV